MILDHGANSLSRSVYSLFVTIGGRKYPVVQFGNKLWMAENLDYVWDGLEIAASGHPSRICAWYYDNDEATYGKNGRRSGLLYNALAMNEINYQVYSSLDIPSGWHVPSASEWDELFAYTGIAGLKAKGFQNWNGTNESKMNVVPTGLRNHSGNFEAVNGITLMWTTDVFSYDTTYAKYIYGTERISMYNHYNDGGACIRLCKNV